MAFDRKKGIMSPELAMQREMEYRHKLEKLKAEQLEAKTSDKQPPKVPLPAACQTPKVKPPTAPKRFSSSANAQPGLGSVSHPRSVTGPIPRSYRGSSPCPPPTPKPTFKTNEQRQLPTSTARPMARCSLSLSPTPQPLPIANPTPSYCGLKRKEPWSTRVESLNKNQQQLLATEPPNDGQVSPFFCEVCDVDCQSRVSYNMHIVGHKHRAKLKLPSSAQHGGPLGKPVQCDLCKIWCMNEDNLRQHYNGKNHIFKLHAAQMQNKG
ncbi:hypothetical protein Dimus_004957 [Dionaea muscipula]